MSSRTRKRQNHQPDDEASVGSSRRKRGRLEPTPSDSEGQGSDVPNQRSRGKQRAVNVEEFDAETNGHAEMSDSQGLIEGDEDQSLQGEEDIGEDEGNVTFRPQLERDEDGYVVGSITRIKVRNFMTYDFAEIHPGPRLNMIVGPNGAGKSTFAAAIIIGLSFAPQLMGRNPTLRSYVKNDTDRANVEIELKAARGTPNHVISREIRKDNDQSIWRLNGKPVVKKDIENLVKNQLGIQPDNLCCFLPQDKVAEFSKMNPVTVLRETMRSAGHAQLSTWHRLLDKWSQETKELNSKLTSATDDRDRLQRQVNNLAPDIDNYNRRRELEDQEKVLKMSVYARKHHEFVAHQNAFKNAIAQLNETNQNLQHKLKPVVGLKKTQDKHQIEESRKLSKATGAAEKCENDMRSAMDQANNAAKEASELRGKLDAVHDQKKRYLKNIARAEQRVRDLEETANAPEIDLLADLRETSEKHRKQNRETSRLQAERDEQRIQVQALETKTQHLHREIDRCDTKKAQLSDAANQRRAQAFNLDPSIQFATEYIEQHPLEFSAKVHLPPMISVGMKDKRYATVVEGLTSVGNRKTFICENQQDYGKLAALNNKQVEVEGKRITVRLHLATVEVTEQSVNPRRPCSDEQLTRLGFEGFAIDYVDAEPAVIAYLCHNAGLHSAAVTLSPSDNINSKDVLDSGITRWHTATDSIRATRSLYGERQWLTTSKGAVRARAFNSSVDEEAIKRLDEEVADLKRQLRDSEQPLGTSKTKLSDLQASYARSQQESVRIKSALQELQARANRRRMAQNDLRLAKNELEKLRNKPDPEEATEGLKTAVLTSIRARRARLSKFTNACRDTMRALSDVSIQTVNVAQCGANMAEVKAIEDAGAALSDKIRAELNKLHPINDEWKSLCKRSQKVLQKLHAQLEPDEKEVFLNHGPNTPADELRNQLAAVQAKIESSVGVSDVSVELYQNTKRQLEARMSEVMKLQASRMKAEQQMTKIRALFDPALDALVEEASAKFGEAFSRINCVGELQVDRTGEFQEWGIKILIAFGDGGLQTLDSRTQSGGERSLTTVTYLLSLATMSRSPFCLVDEINQGMDAQRERQVHDSMVRITCEEDNVGQYFVITPKLLTGLNYHRNMKVLVVNSGPFVPVPSRTIPSFGSLSTWLDKYADHVQQDGIRA